MLTPEERAEFEDIRNRLTLAERKLESTGTGLFRVGELIPNEVRIGMGVGFIGRTTDTTPGGAIIVNSPEGPIKILVV